MCGICGIYTRRSEGFDEKLLKEMCRTIRHRGPDDEGIWISEDLRYGKIGLGHKRLSIIDLSDAGRQPITNEDQSLWLVFNGEIYNYQELKKELINKGHHFSSETDSEVILHLYEEEGIKCLDRFNGMFSFGLWDDRKDRLILCRDRLGIKPLVYYWDNETFIFASEIKAILSDPNINNEIDWTALGLYLNLSYVPSPWTIFKKIKKLRPGHYLIFEKNSIRVNQYWDLNGHRNNHNNSLTFSQQKQQLFDLVNSSVNRRLISDVPLGAFLSGGIDSSIIVGLMARNMSRPVQTFSIGYKDLPLYDETAYAQDVAKLHETDHHEFKISYRDVIDIIPKVLDSLDEPFSDSSVFPTYIVSQKTREMVTVALAGDGADELFAGYRKYTGEFWIQFYSLLPVLFKNLVIHPVTNLLPDGRDSNIKEKVRRFKKFINGAHDTLEARIRSWREIFSKNDCFELLKPDLINQTALNTADDIITDYLDRFKSDSINKMLYSDVKDSLPDDMLNKVDRMSMMNSLEVRVPFLDHEVVEYVFQLDGNQKLHRGKRKYILLETFKEILPKSLLRRPKWGFEVPISVWLKNELRFLIEEYLSEGFIKNQGIFNYPFIQKLVDSYLNNKEDNSWQIWNLVVFGYWFKRYLRH